MRLDDDIDLDRIAALTVKLSGADTENLVNEAALLAGRKRRREMDIALSCAPASKVVPGGKRETLEAGRIADILGE